MKDLDINDTVYSNGHYFPFLSKVETRGKTFPNSNLFYT